MMRFTFGKLSKKCIEKIPKTSFTHLLLKSYDSFIIEEKEYVQENKQPLIIKENIYSQNIIHNEKNNIQFITSMHREKMYKNKHIYQSSLYFHYFNGYLTEQIDYNDNNENYEIMYRNPNKKYITIHSLKDMENNIEIQSIYRSLIEKNNNNNS
jgi:hypothetical protein